jgi:hypothetical protein
MKNAREDRPMLFGILALALQACSVLVAVMLLCRERTHGWTCGHPVMFEFQSLLSTVALLLSGSLMMAISGLIFDARRVLSFIAVFLFLVLIAVIGGMHGIG